MASQLKNQLHTYPPGASETGCAYPYCPDPIANNIVLDDLHAVIAQTNLSNEIQQLLAVGLPAQSTFPSIYYHIVCDEEYVDPGQLSGIVADFCLCYEDPELAASNRIDCELLSDVYWYHPDYVGSNELITDITGEPYQYFFYTPFGETILQEDAFNASYDNPWRFNGKEIDPETGNYYYGARYYNPKWSVWLSVDPLAHKYPSMSPFVFTGNNPIMLVDPDGRDIYVTGDNADEYIEQLQSRTKMEVKFDTGTGRVTFEGKPRNKFDRAMVDASTSTKFDLRIETTNDGSYFFGGAFLGASQNKKTGKLDVFQIINTNVTKSIDEITENAGLGVGHETIEAYLIGSYMTQNNIQNTRPSTVISPNPIFEEAHRDTKKFGVNQESFF